MHGTFMERFWKKVDKNGPIPARRPRLGRCWEWRGMVDGKGYGVLGSWPIGHSRRPHRFSYFLQYGPIPAGLTLHHQCENKRCVNPVHLKALTTSEHSRISNKGRRVTHCPHGHLLAGDNLRLWVNKKNIIKRACRICHRKCVAKRKRALALVRAPLP